MRYRSPTIEVVVEATRGNGAIHSTSTYVWDLTRPRDGPNANCWLTRDVTRVAGPTPLN